MIKLMELSETDAIMNLWRKEMKSITGLNEEINEYSEAVEEALGHANVYVAHEANKVIGFATVLEGFYISDLIYTEEEIGKALLSELKNRYDELQIDIHHDHKANQLLPVMGFTKLSNGEHDILGFDEIEYECFAD